MLHITLHDITAITSTMANDHISVISYHSVQWTRVVREWVLVVVVTPAVDWADLRQTKAPVTVLVGPVWQTVRAHLRRTYSDTAADRHPAHLPPDDSPAATHQHMHTFIHCLSIDSQQENSWLINYNNSSNYDLYLLTGYEKTSKYTTLN